MILLDTNVISEPLRPQGNFLVADWLNAQQLETLYLSTITLAEIRYGLASLPEGKKKRGMLKEWENTVLPLFAGRILLFDEAAASAYAMLQSQARRHGKPLGFADACIAAIAKTNGMIVATRDTQPFAYVGIDVINPWGKFDI